MGALGWIKAARRMWMVEDLNDDAAQARSWKLLFHENAIVHRHNVGFEGERELSVLAADFVPKVDFYDSTAVRALSTHAIKEWRTSFLKGGRTEAVWALWTLEE